MHLQSVRAPIESPQIKLDNTVAQATMEIDLNPDLTVIEVGALPVNQSITSRNELCTNCC